MMNDRAVFVDTNVLVYAAVGQAPCHSEARRTLRELRQSGHDLWLSRQVLREFLATLTRPQTFSSPVSADVVASQIEHFEGQFQIAEDGPDVTRHLLALVRRIPVAGKQIHDANVVATMLTHGIPALLTHNVIDFQRFSDDIEVLPLQVAT